MKIISNLPDTTAPTGPRPDGALKDVSAPGAGDGTPSRSDWHNDHYYALLAIMDNVAISADDSDEEVESGGGVSQFLDAMRLFVQENAYPGLDFGIANITSGNQSSDITIYEAGGGSEKEDGFTVRLRWTGGDGTFAHTITAANTIGNEMAGFLASSAWQGDGAGELVLRLDKTNSKWLVLTPGVWDNGSFTGGDWEKYVNKSLIQRDATVANLATGQAGLGGFRSASGVWTFTYPITFIALPFLNATGRGVDVVSVTVDKITETVAIGSLFAWTITNTGSTNREAYWVAKGFWA